MKRKDGNSPPERGADAWVLSRGMSLEQGFRAILTKCLDQMQASAFSLLRHGDAESLHQMRVGLRRLRSALRLWARWAPFPPALQEELRWLAGVLGAARDADVLADSSLMPLLAACPQETALQRLHLAASASAAQKRRRAAAAVASARCSRLMLGLAEQLQASRWHASIDENTWGEAAEPLQKHAQRLLDRCRQKLLKRGTGLVSGTAAQRHRVRIAAKQARHATEFFLSLQPRARAQRRLKLLTALQDTLGTLNDLDVADRLLLEMGARRPGLAGAASFARGCLCAAARQQLPVLARQWKQFSVATPP